MGCHWLPWRTEEVPCAGQVAPAIPRRYFIEERRPLAPGAVTHPFVHELTGALNLHPGCQGYLIPWEQPLLMAGQGTGWQPPAVPLSACEAGAIPAIDQYLLVEVTEVVPYRPMRLSAVLELRSAANGFIPLVQHRSWEGGVDAEPLHPKHYDTRLFEHPEPMFLMENRELGRLSPRVFFQQVARLAAAELCAAPLV